MTSNLPRRIDVFARGKYGFLLSGTRFDWFFGGMKAGHSNSEGKASFETPNQKILIAVSAKYKGQTRGPVTLHESQNSYTFTFDEVVFPIWRDFLMKHFPAIIGIFFILLAVSLAFVFTDPTELQHRLILAMFALGGGGFGGEIAGFINTDLTLGKKLRLSAGGAAAIFIVLFFFVPV